MTELERLANEIFAECKKNGEPVTETEAREMAKMEMGEKKNRRYEKSDTPRKPTTRERKVDTVKVEILKTLAQNLTRCVIATEEKDFYPENICVPKAEKEITFTLLGSNYSISLTKHRPPKN